MRTSAWVTILGLAGLAVACGDQPTEPLPDREAKGLRDGSTVALATASSGDGYSITTDKDDYQPGDVVHLTGAGWEPEDVLDIVLNDEPQTHPPLQWSVTIGSDGTFTDDTYTVDEGDLNVTFTLMATSRSNGQSLSMTFTDGNLQGVALTPANVFVPPTGTASTSIDVTIGGSGADCTVTLSLLPTPALPAGASASITPNTVQTGSTSFSRTLTFTTMSVTPGSYPFTVHAVRGANCQGNGNVDVSGNLVVFGAATKLVYGQQPSNTPGGGIITPPATVRVLDANNNLVANSGASIQIALQNNPGSGTLAGSLTLAAIGGIATFSDLSIDKIGTGYTLRATSGALTGVTSSGFNITLGTAVKLGFTVQPTGANINANLGTQPRVAVLDAGGNIRNTGTGSGATITLAVTPGTGSGTLSCTTNPLNATNGVAIFAGCKINAAGTGYTLRATSPGLTSIDSDPLNIINPDNSAPSVTCTVPDLTIWYATDVQVPCTASDPSGLANSADASFTLSTNVAAGTETTHALTNTRTVCDTLNNCTTVGFTFKVDKKSPMVSCGSADGLWHSDNVSVHCTATDGGSGIESADRIIQPDHECGGRQRDRQRRNRYPRRGRQGREQPDRRPDRREPGGQEGPAIHLRGRAVRLVGGRRDPRLRGGGRRLRPRAYFRRVIQPAHQRGREHRDGHRADEQQAARRCGGNKSTAGPWRQQGGQEGPGGRLRLGRRRLARGRRRHRLHRLATAGSGLADAGDASFNLHTDVAANTETANASTGSRSVADVVGNSATAGPVYGNQIDKKGPTLSLTCPNAPILLNQPVSATWTAGDGGSGVATGFTTGSFSVPSNTVGPHTATAAAGLSHDNVGNTSTASPPCGYGVNYNFAGFYTPVDNGNTMNGANSGQAIPLKWTLKDFNGAPVTTLSSVNVTAVSLSCGQGTTTDLVEEYAAGASGLINKGDGSYQFNWKTPTSYAKSCKTLKLDLGDGSPVKIALFEFKK